MSTILILEKSNEYLCNFCLEYCSFYNYFSYFSHCDKQFTEFIRNTISFLLLSDII